MFYWRIGHKESNGNKIILIIVATWKAFLIKIEGTFGAVQFCKILKSDAILKSDYQKNIK